MTRSPYSAEQLAALVFACESRYQTASLADARFWLDACHVARDRLAHAIALGAV